MRLIVWQTGPPTACPYPIAFRVFEDLASLDLISNGRAELIAGRGGASGSKAAGAGMRKFEAFDISVNGHCGDHRPD
jgi:hypothetical protein